MGRNNSSRMEWAINSISLGSSTLFLFMTDEVQHKKTQCTTKARHCDITEMKHTETQTGMIRRMM